jgi:REP element-mobilizing transposase RayT
MKKHRNSQKRIIFKDACYFITTKTFNNFPYFKEKIFCDLFVENMKLCKQLKGFLLYGWVVIYDHTHLLVQPNDKFDISKVMKSLKENVSCSINRIIKPPEVGTTSSRLQKLYKNKYDILHFQSEFHKKYPNGHPYPKFQWQESFNDHYIRNDWDFNDKMEYIAWNPDKHGLPSDWPYVYTNPDYEKLIDEC